MNKVTILYGKPKNTEAFEQYYKEKHIPLAAKMPGVDHMEFTQFDKGPDGNDPVYYRMAELYFPSEDQMQRTLRSPEGQSAVDDISNFATGGVTMLIGGIES